MSRSKFLLLFLLITALSQQSKSQQISKEELIFLTPEWKGERFADGRPKVPDNILQHMKLVSQEEAWAVMKNAGYGYQVAEGWKQINPDSVLVGRAQRIANLANLYYVPFAPHMVASFLGAMAAAHVCASVPNFFILEWQSYFHTDPMFKEIITYEGNWVENSFITVSEKPGIGVEINEAGMKKYAIPGIPFFE